MKEVRLYRVRLLERLLEVAELTQTAALGLNDVHAEKVGDWSAHQMLVHVRDVNRQVYFPRMRQIIADENPLFVDFDGDADLAEHYDPGENLQTLLTDFVDEVQQTAAWLQSLPAAAYTRKGTHPKIGTHSLQWWVERALAHMQSHLDQLQAVG